MDNATKSYFDEMLLGFMFNIHGGVVILINLSHDTNPILQIMGAGLGVILMGHGTIKILKKIGANG